MPDPFAVMEWNDVEEQVLETLGERGASNVADLARRSSLDAAAVEAALEELVRIGKVEVLRPVGYANSPRSSGDRQLLYFRRTCPQDRFYLWQAELMARPTRKWLPENEFYL